MDGTATGHLHTRSAVDIFREVLLSDGLSLPMSHQPLDALF